MEEQRQQEHLNSEATAARLRHVCTELQLGAEAFRRAFELAGHSPDAAAWQRFLNRILLVLGVALIIVGAAAFFAHNWAEMHRFVKFALIQGALFGAVLLAWWSGIDSPTGKSALFAAAASVGVLLAVYGQAYQTGADPYSLFLGWLMLIALWAGAGRHPGIWLLVAVLANLTLILYWIQVLNPPEGWTQDLARALGPGVWLAHAVSDFRLAQLVFSLNAVMLAAWEWLAPRPGSWMTGRTYPRILALFAQTAIVIATLKIIFIGGHEAVARLEYASPLMFVAFTGVALWYYQRRCHDLLMLAMCVFGTIVVVTSLLARGMRFDAIDALLLLGMLLVAQTAAAAMWLRKVSNSWRVAQ